MVRSKKGLSVVISVVLMILIASVVGSALFFWFQTFQSEYEIKQQLEGSERDLEILGIQYVNALNAIVGVKNNGPSYQIVNKIEVNGQECDVVGTNVVDSVSNLYVDCPVILDENFNVEVFSDEGISSRTFTSFEVGLNLQENFVFNNLTIVFRNNVACQPWETKLYGLDSLNRSHAQSPQASPTYSYSICANHTVYTIGTSCSVGLTTTAFTLGAPTNSHVYFNTAAASPEPWDNYYDFTPVCISAIGASTVDSQIGVGNPSALHKCIGSVSGSDFTGYTMGDCNAYPTKVWLRVD